MVSERGSRRVRNSEGKLGPRGGPVKSEVMSVKFTAPERNYLKGKADERGIETSELVAIDTVAHAHRVVEEVGADTILAELDRRLAEESAKYLAEVRATLDKVTKKPPSESETNNAL